MIKASTLEMEPIPKSCAGNENSPSEIISVPNVKSLRYAMELIMQGEGRLSAGTNAQLLKPDLRITVSIPDFRDWVDFFLLKPIEMCQVQ